MSEDITDNKALVLGLLSTISKGGDISPFFSDNATWWVPDYCELSGSYKIQELLAAMGQLFSIFRLPPQFQVHHVTAEQDRVSVDCDSTITLLDGSELKNNYHFLMKIRDGKIFLVKEFLNTAATNHIFEMAKAAKGEVCDG